MTTAHDLANAYFRAVSAYWRGDSDVDLPRLGAWLDQFWVGRTSEPKTSPVALSPHAAGGHGIRWHEEGQYILGYVPGRHGCYRIPRIAHLPLDAGSALLAPSSPTDRGRQRLRGRSSTVAGYYG